MPQLPEFRYSTRSIKVSKHEDTHPEDVAAIGLYAADPNQIFDPVGWLPNFTGPAWWSPVGNGDLAGCVFWERGGVNSPGKKKDRVPIIQPPMLFPQALRKALAWSGEEIEGLDQALSDVAYIHEQLGSWLQLSDEEITDIIERESWMLDLLSGARDIDKMVAESKVESAQDITDSIGRRNPSATRAKLLVAVRHMQKRLIRAEIVQVRLQDRLQWANYFSDRYSIDTEAVTAFLRDHDVLGPDDVERFYDICRDVLNPTNLFVNWLCWEIQRRGGRIDDPQVLETARESLALLRLSPQFMSWMQPLASRSLRRAQSESQRYQGIFLPKVRVTIKLLERFGRGLGYPLNLVVGRLLDGVRTIEVGLEAQNWPVVIQTARELKHYWFFRSTREDPLPDIWYKYTPPGTEPNQLDRLLSGYDDSAVGDQEAEELWSRIPPRR